MGRINRKGVLIDNNHKSMADPSAAAGTRQSGRVLLEQCQFRTALVASTDTIQAVVLKRLRHECGNAAPYDVPGTYDRTSSV